MVVLSIMLSGACDRTEYDIDYPEYVLSDGYDDLELSWAEEFSYDGLPSDAVWGYEEGYAGDGELQDYRRAEVSCSYVDDGILTIKTVRDTHNGDNDVKFEFSSAALTSAGKQTFGEGRLDIMARIPTGRGLHPYFVLLPADESDDVTKVELMSYVYGNQDARNRVYSKVSAEYLPDGFTVHGGYANCVTLETAFHLYSVVISDDRLEFLFDNRSLYVLTAAEYGDGPWPFTQAFHLEMGVAVGGIEGGAWGIDTTVFPTEMAIDYIRYYTFRKTE